MWGGGCGLMACDMVHGHGPWTTEHVHSGPQAAGSSPPKQRSHSLRHPTHAAAPCPAWGSHCWVTWLHFHVGAHACMQALQPTSECCQPAREGGMDRATDIDPGVLKLGYQLVQVWSKSDEWWVWGVRCKWPTSGTFAPPPPLQGPPACKTAHATNGG